MEWRKEDLKFHKYKRNRDRFKEKTKEERARILGNVICPKCGYQNHYKMVKKKKNMVHVIYVKLH